MIDRVGIADARMDHCPCLRIMLCHIIKSFFRQTQRPNHMSMMLLPKELHIALSDCTIHDPAIPLSTSTDAHCQLSRKLNAVSNEPQQFKKAIIFASNHRHSNLCNKAAQRLLLSIPILRTCSDKLPKPKTPRQNSHTKSLPISASLRSRQPKYAKSLPISALHSEQNLVVDLMWVLAHAGRLTVQLAERSCSTVMVSIKSRGGSVQCVGNRLSGTKSQM